jgi:predicted Zn-ribbon and HTH transcriptional regulator
MGEVAEMMLDGTLCQYCGAYLDDSIGYFPQSCPDCKKESGTKKKKNKKRRKK